MPAPRPLLLFLLLALHRIPCPAHTIYVHVGAVTGQAKTCASLGIGSPASKARTAASSFGGDACDPQRGAGRIGNTSWCPRKANPYEYFQVSLDGGPTKLSAFSMQGTVTEFEVAYALNDIDTQYTRYRQNDAVVRFANPQDGNTTWRHTFSVPGSNQIHLHAAGKGLPLAQFVRFYPKRWLNMRPDGTSDTFSMKVDLESCVACGDGFWDRTEDCDDGNMIDGDGCSGTNSLILGYPKPCTKETHLGLFWCEPRTEGPRRGNALGDCLYRQDAAAGALTDGHGSSRVMREPQKRYYASGHYDRRGGISTGGYNSGILPLCNGVVCDGQNPFG